MPARSQLILLGSLALVLVASLFSNSYNPYFLDIAVTCGINITLAVSLNLINGYTGQFSLGHAGFMAIGAYSSAFLTTTFDTRIQSLLGHRAWIVFPVALCIGGFVAAVAGLVVGIPSLRLKGDYLAIVTLGFGEIIRVILNNIEAVGGARGMTGIPDYTNLFWAFGLAAITVYVVWALVNSTYGRGFIAVSDDEVAAEAMGINTTRYKIIAFVVGAFFAGAAGGIYAHFKQYIAPVGFDFNRSIEIVVMVILGGMGKNTGVIIAAVLLTFVPEGLRMLSNVSPKLAWIGESRMLFYSLLLIILMIVRPQGLFTWPMWKRKAA
jgi:branched-chain amino acid transport system permease protein